MLDTTILVAAERRRFDLLAFYSAHADEELCMSAITASELLHGVERASTTARRHERNQKFENYLRHLAPIEFDLAVARQHAVIWSLLEKKGQMIGAHDLLIAATALQFGHAVATLNHQEFSRVPGLRLVETAAYIVSC